MNMKIKPGDLIVSDDYSAIGILTKINNKLFVVCDFEKIEYDEYNADWEHFDTWKEKVNERVRTNYIINLYKTMKRYIVNPKLIRKKHKIISITCGGDDCNEVREIIYGWNDMGKDKLVCSKCERENHFEIPELKKHKHGK